ncbi:MAG: hypothetical protein QW177_04430 [Candidatus Nitrosotenuis sp.]
MIIKRLIEKEQPLRIITSSLFSKMVQSVIKGATIKTKFLQEMSEEKLFWDNITVKYNIGRIQLSFTLSANNYKKIKKVVELVGRFFYNFWLDCNGPKKRSVILLEFNTEWFADLLYSMKNYLGNVILVNQRRPAIWNKKTFNIIKKSNCFVAQIDRIVV